MKKSQGSSVRGARAGKNEKSIKPKKVDFSDIPELSDEQLSSTRRVGRAIVGDEPRKLIAIRLDAKVLGWLSKTAKKKALPVSVASKRNPCRGDAEGELATGRGPTFRWRKDGRCSDELIVAGRYLAT